MERSNLDRQTFTVRKSQLLENEKEHCKQEKNSKGAIPKLNRPTGWGSLSLNNRNKENVYERIKSTRPYSSSFNNPSNKEYSNAHDLNYSDLMTNNKIKCKSTPMRDVDESFHLSDISNRSITLDSELRNSVKCSVDDILATSFAESVRNFRKSSFYSNGNPERSHNSFSGYRSNQSLGQGFVEGTSDITNRWEQDFEFGKSFRSELLNDQNGNSFLSSNEKNISVGLYFAKRCDNIANFLKMESPIKRDAPVVLFSDSETSTGINSENVVHNNKNQLLPDGGRLLKKNIYGRSIEKYLDHNKENMNLKNTCSNKTFLVAESLKMKNEIGPDKLPYSSILNESFVHTKHNFEEDVSEVAKENHQNIPALAPSTDPMISVVNSINALCPSTNLSQYASKDKVSDGISCTITSSHVSNNSNFSYHDGQPIPLKITELELSWASVKLRTNSKKSLQIKNTSQKRLKLRIDIDGPGYQLLNSDNILTLQPQECHTIVVNFYPTIIGPAIGRLIFRPLNRFGKITISKPDSNFSSPSFNCNEIITPLYAYGGHCSIILQGLFKGPVGPTFLPMGELYELGRSLERTFRIYNKGPLLGFAALLPESIGLQTQEISKSLRIQPEFTLIEPDTVVTISLIFEFDYKDLRNVKKNLVDVMTLAKVRVFYGDEPTRQRLRKIHEELTREERDIIFPKSLDMLWRLSPNEKLMFESCLFKKTTSSNAQDMLRCISEHEITLTLNNNTLDEAMAELSTTLMDEESSILFRTICGTTSENLSTN